MRTLFVMLNLAAAMLYLGVAAICAGAALKTTHGLAGGSGVRRFWWMVAIFFVSLSVMRLTGAEDLVRGELRSLLHAEGVYRARRTVQGLIVIGVLVAIGLATMLRSLRARRSPWRGRTRPMQWARWGMAAMGVLIVLRLISLHSIDRLLYAGPRFNWLVDVGSSLLVTYAAIAHIRGLERVRSSARRRHRTHGN